MVFTLVEWRMFWSSIGGCRLVMVLIAVVAGGVRVAFNGCIYTIEPLSSSLL